MDKTFMAFEYAGGYTELPDKEGNSIRVENSQLLMEGKAEDRDTFIKKLKAHLASLDISIEKISVEIKEITIHNTYYI